MSQLEKEEDSLHVQYLLLLLLSLSRCSTFPTSFASLRHHCRHSNRKQPPTRTMSKTPPLVHNTLINHSLLNHQEVVSTVMQLYLRSASEHPSEREIQDIPPSSYVPCQDTQLLQAQHNPFAQQHHQTPQQRRRSWDTDPGTSLGNMTVEWESPPPVTLLSLKINCCLSAPQNHHSKKWDPLAVEKDYFLSLPLKT